MSNIKITEIKKAIHTKALTWTSIKKVYYTQAIQNTAFPYCVFFLISDIYSEVDTKDKYEDVKVQFNVYSVKNDNGDEIETILDEIETSMKSLTVSYFTVVRTKMDFKTPAIYKDKVWQGVIQFNIHLL